jgi:predicted nuclease of predicted toxin-antitoxin system
LVAVTSPDLLIWDFATKRGDIIVSKDADFATLVTQRPDGPTVVWVRTGNTRKRVLIPFLTSIWPSVLADIAAGKRLVEIR